MSKKTVGYISVIVIGVGFVLMAAGNVLGSEVASIMQAVLGVIFILGGICKLVADTRKKEVEGATTVKAENGTRPNLAMGLSLGMLFGISIGSAMDNLALGLAIGSGMGCSLGLLFEKRAEEDTKAEEAKSGDKKEE